MTPKVGETYTGPLGVPFTVERVSDEWVVCQAGPGRVQFPARDAAKWLKSPPLKPIPGPVSRAIS